MSNVYFIGSDYKGCNYLRCQLPMFHNGWNGSHILVGHGQKDPKIIKDEILNYDIIVFHRPDTPEHHKLGQMLKAMGKKIVFDNDDTYKIDEEHPYYHMDEENFLRNRTFKNNIVDSFILNSDLVTCTTEALKEEYSQINPNVIVLPNCVDPLDWDEPLRNEGDKVRIGIVGSTLYHHDFKYIESYIRELSERDDVQLVLFGLHTEEQLEKNRLVRRVYKKELEFWRSLKNLERVPFCRMEEYFTQLNELRLDIMLIPRKDSALNKAKSNVKYLEAAMCEIPVIAQSFVGKDSPYDKDLNGKNGILASNEEDFRRETERLIKDKELRRAIGKEAKRYVLENYNIENKAHLWKEAYETLTK